MEPLARCRAARAGSDAIVTLTLEVRHPMSIADRTLPASPTTVPEAARADDPVAGILLLLLAILVFSCGDATAKYLSGVLPVFEIMWLRYVVFVLMLMPSAARSGRGVLRSARPGLQVLRGLSMLLSSLLYISALPFLPLADATAIAFVSPLFITALSIPFLGEQVGMRRWAAILVGLIGVVIVMRPGTGAFRPAAILPIFSALAWAAGIILTRKMRGADGALTTLIYTAVPGLLIVTAIMPFDWVTPDCRQLGLSLLYGLFASGGQWLIVLAYRRAGASLLAPLAYSQLVWAVALGFFAFGAVPDSRTMIGAAVIIASGLYTAHRERIRARS
jgi:drug/metabolite transporter (DMT)-like permease